MTYLLVLLFMDVPEDSRKNWARLIQKIYEVDPLTCPKCQGSMRVIAFIENEDVIRKILKHLGLWEVKRKPRPRANAPPIIPDLYPIPSVDDYLIRLRRTTRSKPTCKQPTRRDQMVSFVQSLS